MDPPLTDEAALADWGFASIFPEATSPIMPLVPPTTAYITGDYTSPWGSVCDFPNWPDFQNATFSNTYDMTSGDLSYGDLSRANSIGSVDLSIGSGGSSNHSWSSWRGRSRIKKVFGRSSSIVGCAKSTMKEGMSSWSLTAKNHISPSPRRSGKLTDVARAGIRLLKGQGACWKCKVLKKSCDPCNPCKECASSTKAAWQEVGCQRGVLGVNYKPVKLCLSADSPDAESKPSLSEEDDWAAKQAEANRLWEEEMRTRCAKMGTTRLNIHRKTYLQHFSLEEIPTLSLTGPALKQQVVKAMRELAPNLGEPKLKQEVFMLLYHASLYEECLSEQTSQTCDLIHLSIRCLNHSMDAIRSQPSTATLHHACKAQRCGLHSIAKLQQSSSRYIDALHDVTFSKWGLSYHKYWWLSIFYSLCIQSLVRGNLIKLSGHVRSSLQNLDQYSNAKLYLHSFISLFEAVSAEHDPIMMEYDLPQGEMNQVMLARMAVNPWHWEERSIHSSYDHLRYIFDMGQKADKCESDLNTNLDSAS